MPQEKQQPIGRGQVQASGGVAAAERGAAGGALREGSGLDGGAPKKIGPHRAMAMRPEGRARR